ncbi:MAG: 5'-3' exonuclease H3TH domain-containing protein, partial [Oscillospiraceae bacterium]|nr:5'-3' exonuclease H3TH domain-containing protein [Oscillospiraceae bacterium]
NAIYGFLTMLHKIKEDTNPDAVAVAFDMRAPTFRHKEYDGYKAQRRGMPPELAQQLPILKELLTLLGYQIVECEGYEADDILGTLARVCTEEGHECVLATGDRDSLQLVNPSVTVRLAATKFGQPVVTVYDEAKIKEDYGVTPHQLIDIKALQGDSSDNIPGVSGIGAKGAADLIQKYGSIEAIYQNFDQLDLKPAMRKKLEEGKESAFLSYKLGTICLQAPIDTNLEHYHVLEGDVQAAVRLMAKLELFSLIKKWGLDQIEVEQEALTAEQSLQIKVCDDTQSLLQQLQQTGSAYFLVSYQDKQVETLYFHLENTICTVNAAKHADFLKAFCESEDIKKYTHDVKPLYAALYRQNIGLVQVEMDTMLAGYLLNPSSSNYEIERMATEYGVEQPQMDSQQAEQDPMVKWAAIYPALYRMIDDKISQNTQHKLLHEIELPLAKVLAQMEELGFAVDKEGIAEYG